MKYIIDEEELIEFLDKEETYFDDSWNINFQSIMKEYLQSKTPVEEVGTGLIGETKSSALKSMEVVGIGIDTPNYVCIKNVELPKLTTKNIGKNIKIYIEVIK